MTTALAASTRPRAGLAANVTRIRPRRYSAVMNIAATTITAISAPNTPVSVCSMGVPTWPPTSGAMSPVPVTVNVPPACRNPAPGAPLPGPPPTSVPAQPRAGEFPLSVTWSKWPVARVSAPPSSTR